MPFLVTPVLNCLKERTMMEEKEQILKEEVASREANTKQTGTSMQLLFISCERERRAHYIELVYTRYLYAHCIHTYEKHTNLYT